jgi:hypothetical protein
MRWICTPIAILLATGALASTAQAEQGTGLYAPFPSPAPGQRAQRFVGELGVVVKTRRLARGHALGQALESPGRRRHGAATARAGLAHLGTRPDRAAISVTLALTAGLGLGLLMLGTLRARFQRP